MAPVPSGRGAHTLESGLLNAAEENRLKTAFIHTRAQPTGELQSRRNMSSPRRIALAIVVGLIVGLGFALSMDPESTSALAVKLRFAKPDRLHRLLHNCLPNKYQHGVYRSDSDAVKAVHAVQPGLATALAELAKRQDDVGASNVTSSGGTDTKKSTPPAKENESSTVTTTPSTTPTEPETTTQDASHSHSSSDANSANSPSPSPSPSKDSPSSSSESTSSNPEPISSESTPNLPDTTSAETTTTSDAQLQPTISSSESEKPPTKTSGMSTTSESETSSSTSPFSSSVPVSPFSFSNASTDAATRTSAVETITTGHVTTSKAVRKTFTTTGGDGGVLTLTSVSWVAVVPSATPSTISSKPSLQNTASQKHGNFALAALVGVLVGGAMLA